MTPQGCERSYENPFFRYGATRLDPAIDFGPDDWNLSFINSLRFNYYPWVPGVISRSRMPFTATWTGEIEVEGEGAIQVLYSGEGWISVGDIDNDEIRLEPVYDRVRGLRYPLPPGRHRILVTYKFDDGFRTRQQPIGPYATLRLSRVGGGAADGSGAPLLLEPVSPGMGWLALGRILDGLIWLIVAGIAVFFAGILKREVVWGALAGAAALAIAFTPPVGQHNVVLLLATTGVA